MKRLICLILLVSLSPLLPAQSTDIQIRRLEYIQKLIDQKQEDISHTQEQKETVSRKKEYFQSKLEECFYQIDSLTEDEYQIVEDIIKKEHELDQTEKALNKSKQLLQTEILQLFFNSCIYEEHNNKVVNEHIFPILINESVRYINEKGNQLDITNDELLAGREKRKTVQSEKEKQKEMSQSVKKELSSLYSVIDSLTAEEQTHYEEIEKLERNRAALETLITKLQSDEMQLSYKFTEDKLVLPIKGEIVSRFGEIADDTYQFVIVNNGIEIKSYEKQPVKAVDFGIVVFAESFRNYGKMVIIDHRNGYFSLYANNGNLLVTKGDVVSLGDEIAIVGKKTNKDYYQLYFELRRNNKPVDPVSYFRE